jgi:membrane peptidoglycan carboxypeptidase
MRRRLFLTIVLLLFIVSLSVVHVLFVDLPSLDKLTENLAIPSTKILARDGRLLYEITDPAGMHHTTLPIAEIPLACQQATIAVEDASFYTNPGVDVVGIVRALWINISGGEVIAGGSTITQQVARNMLLDPQERAERTPLRKLRESILAWRLSQAYSKDQILELYLNQTYYGHLAYGIESASKTYFGKSNTPHRPSPLKRRTLSFMSGVCWKRNTRRKFCTPASPSLPPSTLTSPKLPKTSYSAVSIS